MAEYLSINEAVAIASQSAGCSLVQVPGKKIMYHGTGKRGESIIMCTPQAKLQPQGFYWTDITEVQYRLLNSYDRAIMVFRLQGNMSVTGEWSGIRPYLTQEAMKYNANEGNHWKLNIYQDRIKVTGNSKELIINKSKKSIGENLKRMLGR